MGLETATYISDLVPTNPVLGDPVSAGDDHIRLIKQAIKTTFPNITGAMNASHSELNYLVGVTSAIQTQLDTKAAAAHTHTESEIIDGGIFPRVGATESITGTWTFANLATFDGGLETTNIVQQKTGAATTIRQYGINLDWNANQRRWFEEIGPSYWGVFTTDDGVSLSRAAVVANRNGYAITNIAYGNNVDNPQHLFFGPVYGMYGFLELQGTEPSVRLYESDAPGDEKYWRTVTSGGNFYLQALSDNLSTINTPLQINRSGVTIDSITLIGTAVSFSCSTLQVNGNTIWHSSNDGPGSGLDADTVDGLEPTSGSFTVYLRTVDNGTILTSGTAYWKKFNNVVSLSVPTLMTTNATQSVVLDGLPAAIQATFNQYLTSPGRNDTSYINVCLHLYSGVDYIDLSADANTPFASTGTKGIYATTFSYIV